MRVAFGVAFCTVAASLACAQQASNSVSVFARLVGPSGRPISYASLRLVPLDSTGASAPIGAGSAHDGRIEFKGVLPRKYKLDVLYGTFGITPATVDVAASDFDIGDVVVQPGESVGVTLTDIVVDPQPRVPWFPGTLRLPEGMRTSNALPQMYGDRDRCRELRFDRYTSIGTVLGKPKAIRVIRLSPSAAKPDEIPSRVLDVWKGVFMTGACDLRWSEYTPWSIHVLVEYEGGKHAEILTDGLHVQLKNQEGQVWYIRLWPSG